MTEQPAGPEAEQPKVKLSRSQQMQNILFGMGTPIYMALTVWWYVRLCWHTRRKHNRFAGAPVTIQLFGADPEQGRAILTEYGIRSAYGLLQWRVIDNQIGLDFMFMVSRASFNYADNILYQHSGDTFVILTNAGTKRGQRIRRPYAQRQPAQRKTPPAWPKQAKLGKTYQRLRG